MDKVKVYLEVLKKHHFWVLCGIVLIVGVVAQRSGNSFFAEQYATHKGQIESTASSVERVSRDPAQPNEKFAAAIKEEHEKLQAGVGKLWTDLYVKQQSILVWPHWINEEEAKQILAVAERRPSASGNNKEALPEALLRKYMERIKEEFDPLFDILDLRHLVVAEDDENDEKSYEGLVVMDPALVDRIRKHYAWTEYPDEHKVLYSQEDLWVYRALFEIIKKTNGAASDHIYAPVKAIEKLAIAQAASVAPQSTILLPGGMKPKIYGEAPTVPPVNATGEEILEGRYVNEDGKPLPATAAPPFKEFNLIPVQMIVLVDQRRIADLLAQCANSTVPFEVRRVRINPDSSSFHRRMPAADPSKEKSSDSDEAGMLEAGYYDVPIEIHGVIFLRKPPKIAPENENVAAAG